MAAGTLTPCFDLGSTLLEPSALQTAVQDRSAGDDTQHRPGPAAFCCRSHPGTLCTTTPVKANFLLMPQMDAAVAGAHRQN